MSKRRWHTVLQLEEYRVLTTSWTRYLNDRAASEFSSSSFSSGSSNSSSLFSSSSSSSTSSSSTSSSGSSSSSSSFSSEDFEEEMMVLIERKRRRLVTAVENHEIIWGRRPLIQDFNQAECIYLFRFEQIELKLLADTLWPFLKPVFPYGSMKTRVLLGNRYRAPYETCLLIYLAKLSRPWTLRPELEQIFGMRSTHLSMAIEMFSKTLHVVAKRYITDPSIWKGSMPSYAKAVFDKVGVLPNLWGFIDGTVRRVCRPSRFQQRLYTRYKRCHAIKFQSVVTPEGFIAHLSGPYPGARHDAWMLQESGLIPKLQELMPVGGNEPVYKLYGDCAYPWTPYTMKGFVNPPPGSAERAFNHQMSRARIAVEWGFRNILQQWSLLNFTESMKIFLEPVGQYFLNAAFLINIRTCFYGNQINHYFGMKPRSLEKYLSLVPNNN